MVGCNLPKQTDQYRYNTQYKKQNPSIKFLKYFTRQGKATETNRNLKKNSEQYYVVGHFDKNGVAENNINTQVVGKIKQLRIVMKKSHRHWVILSDIHLRTIS